MTCKIHLLCDAEGHPLHFHLSAGQTHESTVLDTVLEGVDAELLNGEGQRVAWPDALGGDKGYDVADFIDQLRNRKVTPHIAVQDHLSKTGKRRKTRTDERTTRHPGYAISQRIRKRIEEVFGWVKVPGGQAKTKFRGRARVDAAFTLGLAAYNLIRLPKLLAQAPP